MLRKGVLMLSVIAGLVLLPSSALADSVTVMGKVTAINTNYMPGTFTFGLDSPMPASCSLAWGAYWYTAPFTVENVKATYAAALAAYLNQSTVQVRYDSTDPYCHVTWFSLN